MNRFRVLFDSKKTPFTGVLYRLFMADTDRRPLTLAVATWEFLDELSKLGTHGTSVTDVAKTLIEEGIRQAIKDGFLKQKSFAGPKQQR
jgi:hypothetical protein